MHELPVAVIGAGPQGLAAAAHLLERGLQPLVLEAGNGPGAAVSQWGHVRLFSAWPELLDPASVRLLERTGWAAPERGYPTGQQWIESYLAPLAAALGEHVRYGSRVVGLSRRGRDRLVDADRAQQPFTVLVRSSDGTEERLLARAVIDASGTWGSPNPVGADGLPALGEHAAAAAISYGIADRADVARHAGKHTVVVGAGHSAFNSILELEQIAARNPGTRITWAIRRPLSAGTFGGGAADELPQRGALGSMTQRAVRSGAVQVIAGFRTEQVLRQDGQTVLVAEDGRQVAADAVVASTGFRPDLSFLSEMRLDLDPTLQAPRRLASEIDPNVHSCGTVRATGAADLAQPEPDLYLVGMKSYGRAPTFLALTGYEQVRSVVAALAGDHEAAGRVELELPDTGVCGGSGVYDSPDGEAGGGCCAPAPVRLELSTPL